MSKLSHRIIASSLLLASSLSLALPIQPAFASFEQTVAAYPAQSLALLTVNLDLARWQYLISKIDQGIKLNEQEKATQPVSEAEDVPDEFTQLIAFLQKDLQFDPMLDGVANLGSHLTLAYHPYANSDGQALFSLNLRSPERAKALIERLNASLVKADAKNRIEVNKFGSETIYTLRNVFKDTDEQEDKYQLNFAFAGSNLIGAFGENPDILKRMLYSQHVLPDASKFKLKNQPYFKAIQASVGEKAAWMYFNIDQMLEFAGNDDEYKELFSQEGGAQFIKDFLGLSNGLGVGFDIDAKGVRIKSFTAPDFEKLSPAQKNYFDALHAKPEHSLDSLMKHMPGQPVFWMMGQNPDPNVPDPSFSKAFMDNLSKEIGFSEEKFYESVQQAFNLDYKQDLLNKLDGRMAFGIFDSGNKSLSTVMMLGIKGGQEQAFDQVTQGKLKLNSKALNELAENFDKSPNETAGASVKANMYSLQTVAETYAVDWGGLYAVDIQSLQKAASEKDYWKDFANPVTQQQGSGQAYSAFADFDGSSQFAGQVFYEPTGKISTYEGKKFSAGYKIYGYDPYGMLYLLSTDGATDNDEFKTVRDDLPVVEKVKPGTLSSEADTLKPNLLETWQGTPIYSWDFMQPVRDEIDKEDPVAKVDRELENNLNRIEATLGTYYQESDQSGMPIDVQALVDFIAQKEGLDKLDLSNPVNKETGLSKSLTDFKNFKADASMAGMIFYEPTGEKTQNEKGEFSANYKLYAYSPTGQLMSKDLIGSLEVVRSDLPKVEIPKEENPLRDIKPVFARHGDVWLLAGDVNSLKAAIKGQKPHNLEQWMQKSKTQSASGVFYLDTEQGLKMLKDSFPTIFEELSKEPELQDIAKGLEAWKSIYNASTHTAKGEESEFWLNVDLERLDIAKWFKQLDNATKDLSSAQERAKISSVKANMHTLQTIVETYGVDWGGIYPEDLESLKREAEKNENGYFSYWKEFHNPFVAENFSYKNYSDYVEGPESAGIVLYEPISDAEGIVTSYKIYGTDENGNLIQDQGEVFYLNPS